MRYVVEQCTECNICSKECPISSSEKDENVGPLGKIRAAKKMLEGSELSEDELKTIYLCTRCRKCEFVCPSNLPVPDLVQALRFELDKKQLSPKKHQVISQRIVEYGNPMGQPAEERNKIVPEGMIATKGVDTLYLTGCWAGYKLFGVVQAAIEIMKKGKINVGMLGSKEKCCGLFLIDNGDLSAASEIARQNVDLIENLGVKNVVLSCAACFYVYNEMYSKLYRQPKFNVKHMVHILKEIIDTKKIELKKLNAQTIVAYSDACHLGRCSGIFEEPRIILKSISGLELRELLDNREYASCCGAPAGVKPFSPEISNNVGMNLLKSAQDVGAETLVVSCPFCLYHLQDVKNKFNVNIEVKEISQFVLEHIK